MAERGGSSGIHGGEDATREESTVRVFFDQYARAMTAGDGPAMAGFWEAPALVLSDEGAQAVGAADEVAAFFSAAREQYAARGITDTRPEITSVRWLTSRLVLVDVRWPYLDDRGQEMGDESATYALRCDGHRDLRVRAVIMHGTQTTH